MLGLGIHLPPHLAPSPAPPPSGLAGGCWVPLSPFFQPFDLSSCVPRSWLPYLSPSFWTEVTLWFCPSPGTCGQGACRGSGMEFIDLISIPKTCLKVYISLVQGWGVGAVTQHLIPER